MDVESGNAGDMEKLFDAIVGKYDIQVLRDTAYKAMSPDRPTRLPREPCMTLNSKCDPSL